MDKIESEIIVTALEKIEKFSFQTIKWMEFYKKELNELQEKLVNLENWVYGETEE